MNLEINLQLAFSNGFDTYVIRFLSYLTDIEWQFDYETIVIYIEISMR